MSEISRSALFGKLNSTAYKAIESAFVFCKLRGNPYVELVHWLHQILQLQDSDVHRIVEEFKVDPARLSRDVVEALDRLPRGSTSISDLSSHVEDAVERAWVYATLMLNDSKVRTGHLLLGAVKTPSLRNALLVISKEFTKLKADDLADSFARITKDSPENTPAESVAVGGGAAPGEASDAIAPAGLGKLEALRRYSVDLTEKARNGEIDQIVGRDDEMRQVIDILMRRRQNNPMLTGEAGVGKTAVVEGLALRIAEGDVPAPLKGVSLHTLDLGLLQAGASVKGEFENRLRNVIDEVKKSPHPIVLFIDEAHTMIGAGGQAGQNDAANLLKPALARGELRTIAATTWSEYKKYFEKDAALARRFQVVKVEEPTEPLAAAMLRGMAPLMEKHFNVRIRDEAITEAVRLSARYITGRQLPDKAISVLDTACAKVALGQAATPAAIEDLRKRIERLDAEVRGLEREAASGTPHDTRLKNLATDRQAAQDRVDALNQRYDAERALVGEVQALREGLESGKTMPADKAAALQAKLAELATLQAEHTLVPVEVDGSVVAAIVAAWTGIPLGKMVKDDLKTVLGMEPLLGARVIGQTHAIKAIAQRVRTSRANLEDPNKPKGVFLFVGPSGVGKTETALALAELLYGGERKLITINMSEYQEAHSVSGLKGSPPGYVGYGEGGVLTEAVRRNPYSVVLLDEAEKAHPDVLELFYQVFDKGVLDDAEGREIDFRNCVIILTSNVGSSQIMQACINKAPADYPSADELAEALRPVLYKTFKPALLGRMKVIPYYAIGDDALDKIIRLKLDRIAARVGTNHQAEFVYDTKLVDAVLARCTEVDTGARNVDHILNGTLLPEIAGHVLDRMADGRTVNRIKVTAGKNGDFKYTVA